MKAEALKGHLDGILLAVLEPGPLHGYVIMAALRVRSAGQVGLRPGPCTRLCTGWNGRAWCERTGPRPAAAVAASTS